MPKLKPFAGFSVDDVDDLLDAKNEFNTEVVPKGVYKLKLKRMTHATIKKEGPNKGATRFSILFEVVGGAGGKLPAKYMGASIWHSVNVIKSGAGFVNDFLNAIAGPDPAKQRALRKAFWSVDIVLDKETSEHVLRIGRTKVGSPNGEIVVTAKTKLGKDTRTGDSRAEIANFLIPKGDDDEDDDLDDLDDDDDDALDEDLDDDDYDEDDDDLDEDDDEEDDPDEDDEDDDEEDDPDEDDEDDDEDDEDEEDDESSGRASELEAMGIAALRKEARAAGISAAEIKGKDKDDLVGLILEAEEESEDDEDEEDEEPPF